MAKAKAVDRLLEILSDGEWHTMGELTSEFSHLWKPERVVRRARHWFHALPDEVFNELESHVIFYNGRRNIISDMLWNIKRRKRKDMLKVLIERRYGTGHRGRRVIAVRMVLLEK